MNEQAKKRRNQKLRMNMLVGFAGLIIVLCVLLISIFSYRMADSMKSQTADMIQHLNSQITSNVDTLMISVYDNASLVCSDSQIRQFDPVSKKASSDTLANYAEKIESYQLLSCYEDFCVVYQNGQVVGKMSETMSNQYSDGTLFQTLNKTLAVKAAGVWTNELLDDHTYISFVKMINNQSILLASISSENFENQFSDSIFMDGMNIYLVNSSLIIQCSTDASIGSGSYLKTHVYRLVDRNSNKTQAGEMYIVSTNKLDNGWYVVTAVPSIEVIRPLKETIAYVIGVSIFICIIAIGLTILISNKIIHSVEQTVDKLDVKAQTDLLTGLINKRSFEEIASAALENPEENMSYALVFMDVDNFKGVNDRCGHDIGDEVLRSFAHTIGQVFRDGDVKGRLGGDEFCVLMKFPLAERDQMVNTVNEVCRRFRDALHRKATSARQSLPAVTSSMGAAMWEGVPEEFSQLYHKADVAVYASKKRGKDTWSVYGQNDVNDSIIEDK